MLRMLRRLLNILNVFLNPFCSIILFHYYFVGKHPAWVPRSFMRWWALPLCDACYPQVARFYALQIQHKILLQRSFFCHRHLIFEGGGRAKSLPIIRDFDPD